MQFLRLLVTLGAFRIQERQLGLLEMPLVSQVRPGEGMQEVQEGVNEGLHVVLLPWVVVMSI